MAETTPNTPDAGTPLSVAHSAPTGRPRWVALGGLYLNLDAITRVEVEGDGKYAKLHFNDSYAPTHTLMDDVARRLLDYLDTIAVEL